MEKIIERKEYLNSIMNNYKAKVDEYIKNGYKLVVYGAGLFATRLLKFLDSYNMHVEAVCVTSLKYNRKILCGVQIYEIDDLIFDDEKYVYLLAVKPSAQYMLENELNIRGIVEYIKLPELAAEILDDTFFQPVIEVTPRVGCNVACRYCPQNAFIKQYFKCQNNKQEMSIEDFKLYINKLPCNCIIDFSGFVEPFLSKDGVKMIEYAHKTGHNIRLFTTLVGLNIDSFKIIENIPFKLVVLHIPDVMGYANIPITPQYLKLIKYVVEKNKLDGSSFVDMANCQTEPDKEIVRIIGDRFPVSWQLVDRAGLLKGKELQSVKENKKNIYCTRAINMNHNVLLPNGDVVLCCMDFGMKRVLGNLNINTYEEIVHGDKMKNIMNNNKGMGDDLCRRCIYANSIEE